MRRKREIDNLVYELLDKVEELTRARDEYLSLQGLAKYSKLSTRTLRRIIKNEGLPCYRVPGAGGNTGKVLVRRKEFDKWMSDHWRDDDADLDAIVSNVMAGLRGAK